MQPLCPSRFFLIEMLHAPSLHRCAQTPLPVPRGGTHLHLEASPSLLGSPTGSCAVPWGSAVKELTPVYSRPPINAGGSLGDCSVFGFDSVVKGKEEVVSYTGLCRFGKRKRQGKDSQCGDGWPCRVHPPPGVPSPPLPALVEEGPTQKCKMDCGTDSLGLTLS